MRRGDGRVERSSGRKPRGDAAEPDVSREITAEAAVWISRLHGPSRSRHMERECLAWQARSPAHRLAFERCTDLWMDVARVDRAAVARAAALAAERGSVQGDTARTGPHGWLKARPLALASAVTAVLTLAAVMVTQPWRDIEFYDTDIGEQRLVVLQDGTRMSLNTATRVRVELDRSRRRVRVEGGEALFEVAKDPRRPFVVQAANTEVTATGTAFAVRLAPPGASTPSALDVLLVEGQVVVRGVGSQAAAMGISQPVVMAPGERIRLSKELRHAGTLLATSPAALHRDRPRMDQALAWKRGEVVFENTSIPEAVAEINRYSTTPIVAHASLSALRISGSFKTGDNGGIARAIAVLHGLTLRELPHQLELRPR